ncbi:hypothetical protein CANINC_004319 [Pichia inconspicua]|uniref:Suppressor of forked domain-containing protein n=1 Tax=Pichia inconspicua TaxID=52247 RepID=A0A4T0WXL1_9ASCO|nr:hypothetical protein CANINC_004319 [[Candida] inconspicua]
MVDIDLNEIPNKGLWLEAAKKVAEHPDDDKSWLSFINLTEYLPSIKQKNKIEVNFFSKRAEKQLVILAYENFLINFPFREIQWVQYAQWHFKFSNLNKSIATFERALKILPHSLIIWNSYLDLILETNFDKDDVLYHFERARMMISYHYRSSSFFDKYLKFLKDNSLDKEQHLLLRRIIELPLHEYLKYFQQFLLLIENANLDTIKFLISRKDLETDFNLTWIDLLDEKKFYKLRTDLRKKFTDVFITTQYNAYKFYEFEKRIKIQENQSGNLNRLQLLNWKSYIEYVENLNLKGVNKEKEISLIKNNTLHIDMLYSRCLTVTSSYQYFWIKYANYYLNYNDFEAAEKILLRGIYMNPVTNFKLRLRLIDIYILSRDLAKGKALILELLLLFPDNLQFFCKLVEIEHFLNPQGVEEMIVNKLKEVQGKRNLALEEEFDYLFLELLKYSSISITRISSIFERFKDKKSYFYVKAFTQFNKYYNVKHYNEATKIPEGWLCEYF